MATRTWASRSIRAMPRSGSDGDGRLLGRRGREALGEPASERGGVDPRRGVPDLAVLVPAGAEGLGVLLLDVGDEQIDTGREGHRPRLWSEGNIARRTPPAWKHSPRMRQHRSLGARRRPLPQMGLDRTAGVGTQSSTHLATNNTEHASGTVHRGGSGVGGGRRPKSPATMNPEPPGVLKIVQEATSPMTDIRNIRKIAEGLIAGLETPASHGDEQSRSFLEEQITAHAGPWTSPPRRRGSSVAVVGSFKVGKSSFVNALCWRACPHAGRCQPRDRLDHHTPTRRHGECLGDMILAGANGRR